MNAIEAIRRAVVQALGGDRRRGVPALTEIERVREVHALLDRSPPNRVVIDPALPFGAWYVVRGLVGPQEHAIQAALKRPPGQEWAATVIKGM